MSFERQMMNAEKKIAYFITFFNLATIFYILYKGLNTEKYARGLGSTEKDLILIFEGAIIFYMIALILLSDQSGAQRIEKIIHIIFLAFVFFIIMYALNNIYHHGSLLIREIDHASTLNREINAEREMNAVFVTLNLTRDTNLDFMFLVFFSQSLVKFLKAD